MPELYMREVDARLMDIDKTELKNKNFECLDGCGMCCLCQPELSEKELTQFIKAGHRNGLTSEHQDGRE